MEHKQTFKVFVKPGWGKCTRLVSQYDGCEIYNTDSPEGLAEASYYGISRVPAVVCLNEHDQQLWKKIAL